ncbi:MAG TPA: PAS domain S-box protein [Tepidisphaeraceae bacterium]|nr:PAS domain S-box protein [Tepidisphaeraceae bacterium]
MHQEHLYRLAVEQVADYAIFMIDLHGRVSSWNAGVRHVLRWDEADWLGKHFSVIFSPQDIAGGIPQSELDLARRQGCADDDRWQFRKDGTRFWASGITTALRDENGNVCGFLKVVRDLTERRRAEERQATLHAVATVLAEAPDLKDAVPKLLGAVCSASGWKWGALWRVDNAAGVLRLVNSCNQGSNRLTEFEELSRGITFAPRAGFPGRVWASGKPEWVTDVSGAANFPRREAADRAGLHGALCFPVSWAGQVLAVMEFFSDEVRPPDEPLLGMMSVVGGQIGQFIDRKLTEDRLRAEEARHAASVQAALDCIVSMDQQGTVTEWNTAAQQTFGYARDEAIGREMAALIIPPAFRQAHREGLARYLATGQGPVLGRRFEITAVRKDGTEFPVELTIIRLPAEGPATFTGYIRDITDQKRAQERRRMSEFRWQRLVEQSPLSTQVFGPDGTIRQVNRAWERLWGVTLADLPDYNILKDEQLIERGIMPAIHNAFAGEPVVIQPIPYVPDRGEYAGQMRWCGAFVYPVKDDAGRVEEVVLVHEDVTERRLAEQALRESDANFRQLAETIPQLAWMAKPDGWIFWYNRRWYEYTGTTPQQMEGWGWQSVHDPAELPRVTERWQHSIHSGEPFEMEFPLKGADGRFRWFLTRIAPLRDGEGKIKLWFGTNTDIEDRRRIAEERAQLLEAERSARLEAERTSRMKDEFLATLSHELRTPLNAILGWSQILASGSRDEQDLAEGLRTIERNARAQTQIIEDLLDMSRIISGKVRLDVQRVDLAAVVQDAVATAKPSADAKGIRLQTVLDPHAGPVSGDPARLQQVMWNLLSNAVKFTPRGGRIQLLLERVNSHVEISVIDTGEGISPEFLPHVFDRFRQADATTTRRYGGLGLGLSIVKQLVELHGGSVRVKSLGTGHGATFTVSLPLPVIHPEPNPDVERRHPRATSAGMSLPDACVRIAGVKVLVVDDEPDARALVKRLLEDCEAQVIGAASAAEALHLVRTERPDVLVADVGMPGEDGYSLIKRVRALGPQNGGGVPSAALTAYARPEDRVKAVLAGFQMHLAKPVEPAELIATVASLAGRTQTQDPAQ